MNTQIDTDQAEQHTGVKIGYVLLAIVLMIVGSAYFYIMDTTFGCKTTDIWDRIVIDLPGVIMIGLSVMAFYNYED